MSDIDIDDVEVEVLPDDNVSQTQVSFLPTSRLISVRLPTNSLPPLESE